MKYATGRWIIIVISAILIVVGTVYDFSNWFIVPVALFTGVLAHAFASERALRKLRDEHCSEIYLLSMTTRFFECVVGNYPDVFPMNYAAYDKAVLTVRIPDQKIRRYVVQETGRVPRMSWGTIEQTPRKFGFRRTQPGKCYKITFGSGDILKIYVGKARNNFYFEFRGQCIVISRVRDPTN